MKYRIVGEKLWKTLEYHGDIDNSATVVAHSRISRGSPLVTRVEFKCEEGRVLTRVVTTRLVLLSTVTVEGMLDE